MKTITPFTYSKPIHAPFSKSYLQRAIAIAALLKGETTIIGYTPSNDAMVALNIIEKMGAHYQIEGNTIVISTPVSSIRKDIEINCGEAGLSTRMFSPILAALYQNVTIDGEGSIQSRPMNMVIEALNKLGIYVESNNGFLPIKTAGSVRNTEIEIDGSESSQLLTGLLIALATLDHPSTIHVKNLKSIPYVQMTLDILKHFLITIKHHNYETFEIAESQFNQPWKKRNYVVEGDWSGASFHIVGGAISGKSIIKGLNPKSSQADRAILSAIEKAGAEINWSEGDLIISKKLLNSFTFDATHCPDLFPPLAALAACCNGTSIIVGTSRLASKESNRALTIQSELGKLGVKVELKNNEMHITGGSISGSTTSSNNDHRIAMMCAILTTVSEGNISIESPDAVNKSYPAFYEDLESQTGIFL